MNLRASDTGARLSQFNGECVVICPRCAAPAWVRESGSISGVAPRRLACTQCGLLKQWQAQYAGVRGADARDDFFGLPFYLQTPCCGATLWVYNAAHLKYLSDWLSASLRERNRGAAGWSNGSLISRLPRWMKQASNRDELEAALKRLGLKARSLNGK